jgi:deoxyribodipyrimidine photo-lyase
MLETLRELARDLSARGSRLHVRRGRPEDVLPAFARAMRADRVHDSRDFSPYGRRRDRGVAERLGADGIAFRRHTGVLVHDPEAIGTDGGGHYTVYSPFRRAWDRLELRDVVPAPERLPPSPAEARDGNSDLDALDNLDVRPTAHADLLPAPGEEAARMRLERWLRRGVAGYDTSRDRLDDEEGTSRLSQDLRFGLLSATEVVARAIGEGEGRRRFRAEIAWRDFYAHVLWHEPSLLRASFRPAMDEAFTTPEDDPAIDAWREGRTGYPVVDAAMRQLTASGWMHNRGRMVVASFLTKHLLVDRRIGERHFWRHLVDGDHASNNGGWQWAASTGTDPQPYFRIFNPTLQGKRFDPDGRYVRRWLPELAGVPTRWIHEPWTMPEDVQREADCRIGRDYPTPIVDHDEARERALGALAAAGQSAARRPSQPVSPRRSS